MVKGLKGIKHESVAIGNHASNLSFPYEHVRATQTCAAFLEFFDTIRIPQGVKCVLDGPSVGGYICDHDSLGASDE